jgi:hypothetical protein
MDTIKPWLVTVVALALVAVLVACGKIIFALSIRLE